MNLDNTIITLPCSHCRQPVETTLAELRAVERLLCAACGREVTGTAELVAALVGESQ